MRAKGIVSRMCFIDLGSKEINYESLSDHLVKNYLGGYGIGAYILLNRQPPEADPLGPEAYLGFTTGPLTGTEAVTGNRFTVVGKSPKTGGWGDANCGGNFGPAMKMAGFDHLFFNGVSESPVVVYLDDAKAEIKPAGDLWGCGCIETEEKLIEEYGKDVAVACIGPAGERISLLACIINQKGRAAGRSGLGAVMGAKKIKAIVARMQNKIPVADNDGLKNLRKQIIAHYKNDNPGYDLFNKYGTAGVTANTVMMGDGPVKNWAGSIEDFPSVQKISDDSVYDIQKRPYGCWKCPVACGGHVKVKEGRHSGIEGHKPEYETLAAFGSMCLNDDLASIVKANNLCNDYGMDTISAGSTIAFAMELYNRGIIRSEDLGGLDLTWGNAEAIVALTEQIAKGEGAGATLFGDGVKAAADRIGKNAADFAMHAGGEELPMHDPRCKPGLGATYVIDATPGRHTQWGTWNYEDGFVPGDLNLPEIEDKYNYGGKGENHYILSNYGHCVNSAGKCWFATSIGKATFLPQELTLVTGLDFDLNDIQEVGARIAALRMVFNVREGVNNTQIKLPPRVIGKPPLKAGPTKGITVDNEREINDYLDVSGWNKNNGCPSKETLDTLGLDWVLEHINIS